MNLTFVVLLLLSVLYLKWICVLVIYILEALWGLYQRNKSNKFCKFLAVPSVASLHLLRGGGGRFVIFNISTLPSMHVRKWLYMGLGAQIDKNVVFHFWTEIRAPYKLKIGKGSIIGDNALLDARNNLIIGANVNLSSNVSIYTEQHDHRDPDFKCPNPLERKMTVKIDDRVWLGSNVIVLPGVHIGEGAVCCAGCVVTKDVDPFSVVAGIPAKKVGERPRNIRYEFDGKSCRFY